MSECQALREINSDLVRGFVQRPANTKNLYSIIV